MPPLSLAAFPTAMRIKNLRSSHPTEKTPRAGHRCPRGPRGVRALGLAAWIAGAVLLMILSARPSLAGAPARIDFSEGQLWGMVRTVADEYRLTVVTPDLVQLELRLAGVDLPERPCAGPPGAPDLLGQPFGEEAFAYLRDLVLDRQVMVDTYGRDSSGRLLAVLWLGEISINLALVKEGLAWVDPSFKVTKVRAGLDVAERQAQVGRYGLWGLEEPEAPWEFRKQRGPCGKRSP